MNIDQDQNYIKLIENIEFQPVFILGLHRSGTSILYKMLTATDCFNTVTAYHLIKYKQILHNHINKQEESSKKELNESFQKIGLEDRGIDRLKLTADFAEEYGFLLGNKTFHLHLIPKNLPLFIQMAKKIQYTSENSKPILLKNPPDLPNFLYIKKIFPEAKFIFIHRHPYKIISSLLSAVRHLFEKKNPYTAQISRIYKTLYTNPIFFYSIRILSSKLTLFGTILLTIHSAKTTNYYMKNIKHLKQVDYCSITYEDLCKNPQKIIENILSMLQIKPKKKTDFTSYIKPRKTQLDPSVVYLRKFIFHLMKEYFTRFGYKIDEYI